MMNEILFRLGSIVEVRKFPRWLQKIIIKRILRKKGKTYILGENYIHCLTCYKKSWSKDDISNRFCLICGYHDLNSQNLFIAKNNPYAEHPF
jgi:hypothetical protein